MNISMLWFDDRRNVPLTDKITRGADHYEQRHGRRPTRCIVSVNALFVSGFPDVPGIRVTGSVRVLSNHFLYTCREIEPEPQEAA